jgi:hypothetical protein
MYGCAVESKMKYGSEGKENNMQCRRPTSILPIVSWLMCPFCS